MLAYSFSIRLTVECVHTMNAGYSGGRRRRRARAEKSGVRRQLSKAG